MIPKRSQKRNRTTPFGTSDIWYDPEYDKELIQQFKHELFSRADIAAVQ